MPTSRGFDLANFIAEFANDYDSPTPEVMDLSQFPSDDFTKEIIKEYLGPQGYPQEEAIEQVLREIKAFLPLVYLQWTFWGLIKASESYSKSKFDYLKFTFTRGEFLKTLIKF